MRRLFSSPDSAEMGLLKSRLEEAGIPCALQNEQISQALPSAAFSAELWLANDEDYRRAVDLCEAWNEFMNKSKCPHCGIKLGNFLYADACPHCHHELEQNTKPLIAAPAHELPKEAAWPIRLSLRVVRLVER
jgi:hypothetical protein